MMRLSTERRRRSPALGIVLLAVLAVTGCGGGGESVYPVRGQIVYSDGSPATDLEGFTVTFESVEHAATAEQVGIGAWGLVQSDGTFTVGTHKGADGAVLGRHRVAISPEVQLAEGPVGKSPIPTKYATMANSGLEVEVARGRNNIVLTLERE
ncbi:MAG: hypothetical protein RBS80_29010 [Thermoguttaceae bacterium]|jgi:hypothetical protein|nr:hypothetical protein [Thermoguttaceae bacterium]